MTPGGEVAEQARPLTGIVPRWEWRTFGERFGTAGARLAALPTERVQESDELYLLSLASDASVKVRAGLMDVKRLEQVNDDGLEQWRPVLKASFPLPVGELRALLATLRAGVPQLRREAYTVDELADEIVGADDTLRAVRVHKHREHYVLDGCMVELTELRADGAATHTIAIESEDPELVARTVRSLELASRPNLCLARGLKALTGFGARRYAVVDVGTNSVKFHVGERRVGGGWRTLVDRAEITRLGEGLDETGELRPLPIERTVEAIAGMADEAAAYGVAEIAAVGTAALRRATNPSSLVDEVAQRCGVRVEVVSGEEEARIAYRAATAELPLAAGSSVVFDTGGGSSQFTFGSGTQVSERFSVDVGAVRLTEEHGLGGRVPDDALGAALDAIAHDLAPLDGRPRPAALVGMGGAVTNLAAVKLGLAVYDAEVVQGTVLDRDEIERQIELYRTRTFEERQAIVGLQPKRADVILAGACVVRTVLAKLDCESFVVSDRGLRHGLLVDRFGP